MKTSVLRTLKELERGLHDGVLTRLSPRRSLLLVEGVDARRFLNGLVTQQVDDPSVRGTHSAHYAGFLTVKGRLLCDALIYERPGARDFMVDVDARMAEPLRAHLERYKLRSQVRIDAGVSRAYALYTLVAANVDARDRLLRNLLNRDDLGHALGLYVDPRWELCIRLFAPCDAVLPLDEMRLYKAPSPSMYDYLRVLHSVYEGATELPPEKAMPLEAQMQHNAGVHFHKGCYLGQELVARTFHRGELHKALFTLRCTAPGLTPARHMQTQRDTLFPAHYLDDALVLDDEDAREEQPVQDLTLVTADRSARTGKVFARYWDLLVAHVRFEHMATPLSEYALRQPALAAPATAARGGTDAGAGAASRERWRIVFPPWWDVNATMTQSVSHQEGEL